MSPSYCLGIPLGKESKVGVESKRNKRIDCFSFEQHLKWDTAKFLKENVVVFNGETHMEKEVRILNGGLVVTHPPDSSTGLAYKQEGELEPVFILLSRDEAMKINSDGKNVCAAMKRVIKQHKHLERGQSKAVFSDFKYCCVGTKPRRSAVGVEPGHYKLEDAAGG